MKAISLWQPFASAIPAGLKHYETRSFEYPKALHGQRIAIQAALKDDKKMWKWWCEAVVGCAHRQSHFAALGIKSYDQLPRGAIVATAILSGCVPTWKVSESWAPDEEERLWGDYATGRFAWVLTGVMWVKPAIPFKGRQGWFDWEPPKSE
jgi:hypothetical protein